MDKKVQRKSLIFLTDKSVDCLRYAIVKQACMDFNFAYFERKRLECKVKQTKKELYILAEARSLEADCLQFFYSEWYSVLCDLDPDDLVHALEAKRIRFKNE